MKEYKIEMKLNGKWREAFHPNLVPVSHPKNDFAGTVVMMEVLISEYKAVKRKPSKSHPSGFRILEREVSEWEPIMA